MSGLIVILMTVYIRFNRQTQHTRFIRLQLTERLVSVSNDHSQALYNKNIEQKLVRYQNAYAGITTLLDLYMGSHLHWYNIIQIWHVYNNVH